MTMVSRAITCPSCAGRGWFRVPVHEGIPQKVLPKYLHRFTSAGVLTAYGLRVKDARRVAELCKRPEWMLRLLRLETAGLGRPVVRAYFRNRYMELTK
jgi:hypothetical protein